MPALESIIDGRKDCQDKGRDHNDLLDLPEAESHNRFDVHVYEKRYIKDLFFQHQI